MLAERFTEIYQPRKLMSPSDIENNYRLKVNQDRQLKRLIKQSADQPTLVTDDDERDPINPSIFED